MSEARLSYENLHATSVAWEGRAVLIAGPSGSGKSDLALRLIDRGFTLVSDDRTIVQRQGPSLSASAPATIVGKLEVRGIGIVEVPSEANVPVALFVELASEMERLPDADRRRRVLGVDVPVVTIDALTASAAAKVVVALDRFGTKF